MCEEAAETYSNFHNKICAQVIYQQSEEKNFTIACTYCEMKAFQLNDFLMHFNVVHLQEVKVELEEISKPQIKIEMEDSDYMQSYEENIMQPDVRLTESDEMFSVEPKARIEEAQTGIYKTSVVQRKETQTERNECDFDESEYTPQVWNSKTQKGLIYKYKCKECDKIYSLRCRLEQHMRTCHRPNTTGFECQGCSMPFSSEDDYIRHCNRLHDTYPCLECNKTFKSKKAMQAHQQSNHARKRNFMCALEKCRQTFANAKQLSTHKRLAHPNAYYINCDMCNYNAISVNALVTHKKATHSGQKPFICDVCAKAFTIQSLLVEHQSTHRVVGGERTTTDNSSKLFLPVKKFTCKICGRAFEIAAALHGHTMRMHHAS